MTNTKYIEPFVFNSRKAYENKYNNIEISIFLVLGLVTLVTSIIAGITMCFTSNTILLGFLIALPISSFACFLFTGSVCIDLEKELLERWKMRDKKYQPIKFIAEEELNSIVRLANKKTFRVYQFIEAVQSSDNVIAIQIPKDAKIITHTNTTDSEFNRLEDSCMFERLKTKELSHIVSPIRQHYKNKAHSEKIKQKVEFLKKQSEINATITNEDIYNLPLYKSLESLKNNISSEIEENKKEINQNIKDYQKHLRCEREKTNE